MKLKFILLLLTFFANVFLFSQNKTSNNKKAKSVENRKTGKKDTTQLSEIEIGKREVLKKLYGDKPYGSLYVESVGHDKIMKQWAMVKLLKLKTGIHLYRLEIWQKEPVNMSKKSKWNS